MQTSLNWCKVPELQKTGIRCQVLCECKKFQGLGLHLHTYFPTGENMKPTSKLRFIERDSFSRNGEHFVMPLKVRILQQLWIPDDETYDEWILKRKGEWRDIPLEVEQI